MEPTDIFSVEKGDELIKPSGEVYIIEKSGFFLSDYWMEEVGKIKVKWQNSGK